MKDTQWCKTTKWRYEDTEEYKIKNLMVGNRKEY